MPFPFTCPHCNFTSQVPDHLGGTRAKCPSCAAVVTIPSEIPVAPVARPPVARPTSAPRPPKKKSALVPVLLLVVGLGLLLFCCGGSVIGGFLLWPRTSPHKLNDYHDALGA